LSAHILLVEDEPGIVLILTDLLKPEGYTVDSAGDGLTGLSRAANELLIEIRAAAVNPSDVKAATGLMPYAVFPRTPGGDYAGVVIDGPTETIGREVFGSMPRTSRSRSTRWWRSLAAFPGRRRPGSACPSSPRWKAFAVPARRSKVRPCW